MRWAAASLQWIVVLFVCVSCRSAKSDEAAALRGELTELKREMAALRARVDALADRAGRGSLEDNGHARQAVSGDVTLWIETEPSDARVTVDGEAVEDRRWRGPAAHGLRLVRVQRSGYRIVEQPVRADSDHRLHYQLVRGRGLQRMPPHTGP
ncbi:MAG: hypothetical protein OXU20_10970 [Myxococcales bacterium]|nr:hypothetical protein [Myxococcales bacterium]MDD9967108.1 hypothetical protein [Myxococcales bacterium]